MESGIDMSNINLGMFKLKEKTTVDPIPQGSLFSRFRMADINTKASSSVYDSASSAGAIRAASQSLASAALAQSEREAVNILRKSPVKAADRPDIKLEVKSRSTPIASSEEKLSSRKTVESDRVIPPPSPIPTLADKKKKVKSSHKSPSSKKEPPPSTSAVKRKTDASAAESRPPSKKNRTTKPFNKLMEGVVFVLSGFQVIFLFFFIRHLKKKVSPNFIITESCAISVARYASFYGR